MKRSTCWLLLGGLLCALGCKSGGNRELLERELRYQEDRIYQLESCLDDYRQQLEGMRNENEELRHRAEPADERPTSVPAEKKPLAPRARILPPAVERPNPADLVPPDVELPSSSTIKPAPTPAPPLTPPKIEPPTGGATLEPRIETQDELPLPDDANKVSRLSIDPLSGGYDADRQGGDEGVTVVVLPQDGQGATLHAASDISIVVMDPKLPGEEARVARWNFSAAEAAEHFRKAGGGLRFDLRWPERLPQDENLKLFVRFTRPDGQRLDAERAVHIKLASRSAPTAWTRPSRPMPKLHVPPSLQQGPQLTMPEGGSRQGLGYTGPPIASQVVEPNQVGQLREISDTVVPAAPHDDGIAPVDVAPPMVQAAPAARTAERVRPEWSPYR